MIAIIRDESDNKGVSEMGERARKKRTEKVKMRKVTERSWRREGGESGGKDEDVWEGGRGDRGRWAGLGWSSKKGKGDGISSPEGSLWTGEANWKPAMGLVPSALVGPWIASTVPVRSATRYKSIEVRIMDE
jgi:hypothetical protein